MLKFGAYNFLVSTEDTIVVLGTDDAVQILRFWFAWFRDSFQCSTPHRKLSFSLALWRSLRQAWHEQGRRELVLQQRKYDWIPKHKWDPEFNDKYKIFLQYFTFKNT